MPHLTACLHAWQASTASAAVPFDVAYFLSVHGRRLVDDLLLPRHVLHVAGACHVFAPACPHSLQGALWMALVKADVGSGAHPPGN